MHPMTQPNQPTFPMNVSVDEARAALRALLPPPPSVTVPLMEAYGLRLGADLAARVDHPSATESALDGIACRTGDTLGATAQTPVRLQVVGESRAGSMFAGAVGPGQAALIYTGAALPAGTDAICPVEQLTFEGEYADLQRPARTEDVRHQAEDFAVGEVVLRAGQTLTPERVALAAALGYAEVPVTRPWRVAVLATGDEVLEPPTPLLPGQVYNSNTYGLLGLLRGAGCEAIRLDAAPDSPQALRRQLDAAGGADLLLTSGGVSMGKYDLVRDLLREEGQVSFWKVRMRPGGPVMAGRWAGLPLVGLPGNPVSSLVVFRVLVQPVLTGQLPRTLRLQAAESMRGVPGKAAFWRGHLETTAQGTQVRLYHAQGSGRLRSLSEAEVLIHLPEGAEVAVGDWVDVLV